MSPSRAVFTLHGLVQRAAEVAPERPAVVGPAGALSYGELDDMAGRVAAALGELGVRPGDRVAVSAPKSVVSVAVLYGIMRAGAAYVPIDPAAPPLRAAKMIQDAGCRVLCADGPRLERLGADGHGPGSVSSLDIGHGAADPAGFLATLEPDRTRRGCESDLAYVLYTSGSTGTPKGVMLTHRNALSFVEWTVHRFGVTEGDRLVSHSPFHFDPSVFDLYGAAMAGASVHILSAGEESLGASMAAAIRGRELTVWYSVPSALVLLCDAATPADLETLRVVLFAGEVFPVKHLRRLRQLVPKAVLANLYGPTETNVCTYYEVPRELPDGEKPLPIGRACENQEVFALDSHLDEVPDGEVGELWVRGPTVMQGYWGDEELTRGRLRQNPLHELYPDLAYRTGDLVRRLPDGNYEFLGRRDHQVKSRGYRIELGEIETALVSHAAVREAAVVAVPDDRIGSRLIAFVSCNGQPDELELKRHCAQRVPRYMVPETIRIEAELRHTSTGKIDRQALAERAAGSPDG